MKLINRYTPDMLDSIHELATDLGDEGFAERILKEKVRVEEQLDFAGELMDVFHDHSFGDSRRGMIAVLDKLRSLGWIEPYTLPVSAYDEWTSWADVPVGVIVEALSPATSNDQGQHNRFRKSLDGEIDWWWADGRGPERDDFVDDEYVAKYGPFRRVNA